ncbi:MAG: hypothetical protein O2816_00915 [Planctomycetota bacterium]|nr:hypothetical protein [Planctomycetota bacterium]
MLLPLLVCLPLTGDVDALRDAHATALIERAEGALPTRLYLDAERCALEAREWDEDLDVKPLLAQVRAGRSAVHADAESEEAYRAFLASKDYDRALVEHAAGLAELREEHAERALALAEDAADPAPALRFALELGVDDRAAKRAVGKQVLASVREAWEQERGLGKLELGERLMGPALEEDALEGRVVVWRSFSL